MPNLVSISYHVDVFAIRCKEIEVATIGSRVYRSRVVIPFHCKYWVTCFISGRSNLYSISCWRLDTEFKFKSSFCILRIRFRSIFKFSRSVRAFWIAVSTIVASKTFTLQRSAAACDYQRRSMPLSSRNWFCRMVFRWPLCDKSGLRISHSVNLFLCRFPAFIVFIQRYEKR